MNLYAQRRWINWFRNQSMPTSKFHKIRKRKIDLRKVYQIDELHHLAWCPSQSELVRFFNFEKNENREEKNKSSDFLKCRLFLFMKILLPYTQIILSESHPSALHQSCSALYTFQCTKISPISRYRQHILLQMWILNDRPTNRTKRTKRTNDCIVYLQNKWTIRPGTAFFQGKQIWNDRSREAKTIRNKIDNIVNRPVFALRNELVSMYETEVYCQQILILKECNVCAYKRKKMLFISYGQWIRFVFFFYHVWQCCFNKDNFCFYFVFAAYWHC